MCSIASGCKKLHTHGLLSGSFPARGQKCACCGSYLRHRENLVRAAGAHIQHMQKALIEMKSEPCHHVLSDLTGLSALAIIRAIPGWGAATLGSWQR